jgi:hypothetical protein
MNPIRTIDHQKNMMDKIILFALLQFLFVCVHAQQKKIPKPTPQQLASGYEILLVHSFWRIVTFPSIKADSFEVTIRGTRLKPLISEAAAYFIPGGLPLN